MIWLRAGSVLSEIEARKPSRAVPLIAACVAAVGTLLSAQVFRSGITAVVLDVIVTDDKGRSVDDLTKADFEVVEDGQAREVISATFVSLPIKRVQATYAPREVWTNAVAGEHRLFTIVIDDLNVSPGDALRARDIIRRFITSLPEGDLSAIVYSGHQAGAQEFTADKRRLLAALDHLTGGRPGSHNEFGVDEASRDVGFQNRGNAHRLLATLQHVTDWLAGTEERRKAILLVTAGTLGPPGPDPLTASEFADELRLLTTAAMRANVAIYPVGITGLSAPDDRRSGTTSPMLRSLADATGGVVTINTNDFSRNFETMVRDSSFYYLVGYTPADSEPTKKASLHRVVVRTRRAGMVVRTRQLYETGRPTSRIEAVGVARVLGAVLPGGRLPIELQAATFANAKAEGRLVAVVEVYGDRIVFEQRGTRQTGSLTYQIVASDVSGKIIARDSRRLDFDLSPDRREQMGASRVRFFSTLDVKPGPYRLRAGVVDGKGQNYGVVVGDLDVPTYGKTRLVLSDILLATTSTRSIPTLREHAAMFESRLPSPPTTQRMFDRDGTGELYAEAYVSQGTQDSAIVTALIVDGAGRVVMEDRRTISEQSRGLTGGLGYAIRIPVPLHRLPRGDYAVQLTARASGGETTRRLLFEIR